MLFFVKLQNVLVVALGLLFSAKPSKAQANPASAEPQIQYVGGITLCADNPKALAAHYEWLNRRAADCLNTQLDELDDLLARSQRGLGASSSRVRRQVR